MPVERWPGADCLHASVRLHRRRRLRSRGPIMGRIVMTCSLALALSSVACNKQSNDPGHSTVSASPSASVVKHADRTVERGPVWEPGKHYRYQLKTSSQVSLNQTSLYDFDLTGT